MSGRAITLALGIVAFGSCIAAALGAPSVNEARFATHADIWNLRAGGPDDVTRIGNIVPALRERARDFVMERMEVGTDSIVCAHAPFPIRPSSFRALICGLIPSFTITLKSSDLRQLGRWPTADDVRSAPADFHPPIGMQLHDLLASLARQHPSPRSALTRGKNGTLLCVETTWIDPPERGDSKTVAHRMWSFFWSGRVVAVLSQTSWVEVRRR